MYALIWMVFMSIAEAGMTLHDASWSVVNDTVMGGVSDAELIQVDDDAMVFSGNLSLDNNGGFTSTRMTLDDPDWSESSQLVLRVTGDGRQYIATVRTRDRRLRRVYYRAAFQTEDGVELEITIPFSDFQAYAYGTQVPSAPPLSTQLTTLGSVGFMLADSQPGPFTLRISEISPTGSTETSDKRSARTPAGISDIFSAAISEGVPLFNNGEPDRCADIYQTAIVSVVLLAPDRLSDSEMVVLNGALQSARRSTNQSDRAWGLREAMDSVMASMTRQ
jgi:NADH dehydrogenase [ubiquinone] 1 alpha subcomplex assembly factor 1